ncbi:C1 family peptidase [Pinibacter soli]|uniref:C1 family peptidase n=1 Tax=Pinibacter soli TaxID=3044211 RepID=A0ABT6R9H0_9BACT|nr:C1 family peptidase [Pinibacter soli]MDI3319192.1 C1 family peptidase [Pinibacter soli]
MHPAYIALGALLMSSTILFSCTKSANNNSINDDTVNEPSPLAHNYGLLPTQPEQWATVPVFSRSVLTGGRSENGLSAASLPSSYLLASPAVRDQGQIGSCTGFCGVETNEILYYYQTNSATTTGLTAATGLSQAVNTQLVNSPLFGSSSALSPLFVYYVERCVINKQSISTDNGAYIVNIAQALQGLSNNSGTGAALTLSISGTKYSFAGDCYEDLYPYPSNGSSTSTQFRTPPSSAAISNATNFTVSAQAGTTGSAGSTTHGYYVINSNDVVADAKTAIANNKPVMMGFNVYDNSRYQYFEGLGIAGYAPNNYTYNPLTSNGSLAKGLRLLGGHAVPLIGYIDDASQPGGGVFICENSWNTNWGYKGYFYMPYSVLKSTKIVAPGNLYVAII